MSTHTVETVDRAWVLDGPDHPLARLTADEIRTARRIMVDAELVGQTTLFPILTLDEPAKDEVLAFTPGRPGERRVRAVLLDTATGDVRRVRVSLGDRKVEQVDAVDTAVDGQPPIMLDEFVAVDEIVKADPGWRAAMQRRGITDLDLVCPCPLSAGSFDLPGEQGRRMLRVLLVAAARDMVMSALEATKRAGLTAVQVDLTPFADRKSVV